MRKSFLPAVVCALALWHPPVAVAQEGGQPGDPMRIAILVDNSQTPLEPLPQIRRGLLQFIEALPPNHELMLVTTGGSMNVRVQPTRDYLEIQEAIGEINFMRSMGNALIGSVQEVYDRYLRTAERRFPMIFIVSTDGRDMSQRVTDKSVNEMLQGLSKTGVLVNAVLLTSSGTSLIRSVTLEMIKRTGGAYESATIATALPARMKVMAGRISEQYKKVSPGREPTAEFRRSAPPK
jgi:hypothetical protein